MPEALMNAQNPAYSQNYRHKTKNSRLTISPAPPWSCRSTTNVKAMITQRKMGWRYCQYVESQSDLTQIRKEVTGSNRSATILYSICCGVDKLGEITLAKDRLTRNAKRKPALPRRDKEFGFDNLLQRSTMRSSTRHKPRSLISQVRH